MPTGRDLSRLALAAFASLLLGGCFLAENDESDPIIPDAALAYPMKVGPAKQCTESSDGEPACSRALLEKRLGGGYSLTVWEKDSEGKEEKGSPKLYRLRKLEGPGVPNSTFLVQMVDDSPDNRYLGLLKRRDDGGWEQLEPQCKQLFATRFAEFITNHWIFTSPEATLDDVTCTIARDGLTDGRLYAILDAPKKTSTTVLFTKK